MLKSEVRLRLRIRGQGVCSACLGGKSVAPAFEGKFTAYAVRSLVPSMRHFFYLVFRLAWWAIGYAVLTHHAWHSPLSRFSLLVLGQHLGNV